MAYRDRCERLTSKLQKLCYLSDTTLRNAKPHHLSLVEDHLVSWPFPPPLLDDGPKKSNSKAEPDT